MRKFVITAAALVLAAFAAVQAQPQSRFGKGAHLDACDEGRRHAKRKRPADCEPVSSAGVARGDFNGDGFADLAVGVPFEDENNVGSVGAVNIIYGSDNGLTSTGDQYLTETDFGIPYTFDDRFGAALASGDFNGDDFADLAIGIPGRPHIAGPANPNFGAVVLIDGSAGGLDEATARPLTLVDNVGGLAGAGLAWGDFNGDGFGDLAVGIPEADTLFATDAGEVQVFYGGENSLTALGAQRFPGGLANSRYGAPLAAGDFNDDGLSDLVAGVPGEDRGIFGQTVDVGRADVYRGTPTGLQFAQGLGQQGGAPDGGEEGDQFGFALAIGDFNGDSRDDLAVGVPGEDLLSNTVADAGAVHVYFGQSNIVDLLDEDDVFFGQGTLPGVANEAGDRMGRALAAGRFDDGPFADLAIGSPGEDVGNITDAGMVTVVFGTGGGLALSSPQHWHQNVAGVPDVAEAGDEFGRALSAWNYGQGPNADLAIGVPFEDLLSVNTNTQQADAGVVHVLYGAAAGLTTAGSDLWHQDRAGIGGAASAGDRFGVTLY